jgi:hypothetical protein
MQRNTTTENTMSIMSLVSAIPLRRTTVRIGGALTWGKERNFKLRVGPDGLDVDWTTRTGFDLDLAAAAPIDLGGEVPPQLAQQIAAAGRNVSGFIVIDPQPHEAERLAFAFAKATPNGVAPGIPVLDAYAPHNGVLVPVALVRKHLTQLNHQTEKGHPMSHPLQRSASDAFRLIRQVVDDPANVIAEIILFEATRKQGFCKRIDNIKGVNKQRAKTLTDAEIDALAKPYGAEIAPRKVSEMRRPLVNPLPDGAFAFVPLLGQRDEANVVLFFAFTGDDDMRLALDIDEVLPGLSRAVLAALGRKPRDEAAE